MRRFSLAGIQRSGNHAILNWLVNHYSRWSVRNNIVGPFYFNQCSQSNASGDKAELHVDTWENYHPEQIVIHHDSEPLIVVVRDPYNWWASWYKYFWVNPNVARECRVDRTSTIEHYLQYVKFACEHPKQAIIFNKWFADSDYRKELEDRFMLPSIDETSALNGLFKDNKGEVIGHGSSFDGEDYDGNAQNMKVLCRYQQCMDDPEYYESLREYQHELMLVGTSLFNMEPPVGLYT